MVYTYTKNYEKVRIIFNHLNDEEIVNLINNTYNHTFEVEDYNVSRSMYWSKNDSCPFFDLQLYRKDLVSEYDERSIRFSAWSNIQTIAREDSKVEYQVVVDYRLMINGKAVDFDLLNIDLLIEEKVLTYSDFVRVL